ncbi:hypothetical protein K439DRAFT_1642169 [Ramaria rubella]|nr:hypothetical protein K439DRAFT_1642169 [Ramaria rubella]
MIRVYIPSLSEGSKYKLILILVGRRQQMLVRLARSYTQGRTFIRNLDSSRKFLPTFEGSVWALTA